MKVTMYMIRGVQIIAWSVSMALMACFTQYSGFSGGKSGAISFLFKKIVQLENVSSLEVIERYLVKHKPNFAAFEHASVNQKRTDKRHLYSILISCFQFMAQRLMEAYGSKLACTIVLQQRGEMSGLLNFKSIFATQYITLHIRFFFFLPPHQQQ